MAQLMQTINNSRHKDNKIRKKRKSRRRPGSPLFIPQTIVAYALALSASMSGLHKKAVEGKPRSLIAGTWLAKGAFRNGARVKPAARFVNKRSSTTRYWRPMERFRESRRNSKGQQCLALADTQGWLTGLWNKVSAKNIWWMILTYLRSSAIWVKTISTNNWMHSEEKVTETIEDKTGTLERNPLDCYY